MTALFRYALVFSLLSLAISFMPVKQAFAGGSGGSSEDIQTRWIAPLMLMADQLSANMVVQVSAIGRMFDAKHQLETQRLFQQKMTEAHRDYQPSEQMCTFGTFARDLMTTDRNVDVSKSAFSEKLLQHEVRRGDAMARSQTTMAMTRIDRYRTRFCEQSDNAGGLRDLCPQETPQHMRNRDINYTQTIDQPLSLDIDFLQQTSSEDGEAVFALLDNLFAAAPLPDAPHDVLQLRRYNYNYLNMRSVTAMRGIARNSMANIVALKTATPNTGGQTNAPYLRALLREFGLDDTEIVSYLGERPSYYAQMEFLTKKLYQNPTFYTNLYDKPANVQRIRAAMKAVKLMQDRDIHAALQRREMLLSMLLEAGIRIEADSVYNTLEDALFASGIPTNTPSEN